MTAAPRAAARTPAPASTPATVFRKERRRRGLSSHGRESLAIFLGFFVAYSVLGYRVVVQQHVVVFDALARLAHAYFVWFNDPPKLSALGFVWPPFATIVFLPLAAIKPLATSLVALPTTSALFAAALMALLNHIFARAGMPRRLRYPLLLAFAANPMIAFYASNGMAEVLYLFFLVLSVYFFLRWYVERAPMMLVLASVAFAIGVLSRYEVITWAIAVTVVVTAALMRQHASQREIEGTLIAYLTPLAYGIGLVFFFNAVILNDPLFWLRNQVPGVAPATPAALAEDLPREEKAALGAFEVAARLLEVNWKLFPLAVIVLVVLVTRVFLRRDLMALTLALLLSLNAMLTWLIVFGSQNEGFLQLRYNMRAMPLALIAVAWLYLVAKTPRTKVAVWAGSFAVVVASIPLTFQLMKTYPLQYFERAFTRAILTGRDQEGTVTIGGYEVGLREARDMAAFIRQNINGTRRILTDDTWTFHVMLLSDPALFLDRIDHGDDAWFNVRDDPFGRVDYVLISDRPTDALQSHYPGLLKGERVPGFTQVRRDSGLVTLALFEVADGRPRERAARD